MLLAAAPVAAAPQWQERGTLAAGGQFATAADGTVVHLVAQQYLQVDASGTIVVDEPDVADAQQGALDFYPEIAVGDDGAVHVVVRGGGDTTAGFDIVYRRRAPAGGWDPEIVVGAPVERNYVVGVVAAADRVVVAHSRLVENVYSVMDLYAIVDGAAASIGSTAQGWLRADNDFRFARSGAAVLLASGEPGPSSPFHVAFAGDANGDLVAQWESTHAEHEGGEPRRGGPATHVDDTGAIHVVYGALHELHYVRYAPDGSLARADTFAMGDLGDWHLSHGNGAVVASADGARVLVIGLQNLDGDQRSEDADVLWAESVDGGATFGPAAPVGVTGNGGEGRQRPRLERLGDTVLLFYENGEGIALATAEWIDAPPGGSTGWISDDGDPSLSGGDDTQGGSTAANEEGSSSAATSAGVGGIDPLPPGGRGASDGCGCTVTPGRVGPLALLLLVLARSRRRSASRMRPRAGSTAAWRAERR